MEAKKKMHMREPTLNKNRVNTTFFTVATHQYFSMWESQFEKALAILDPSKKYQWVVLTDDLESRKSRAHNCPPNVQLVFFESPYRNWPEVTLFRYEIILQMKDLLLGEQIVWLDADMELQMEPRSREPDKLHLCPHPGFNFKLFPITFRSLAFVINTFNKSILFHAIGPFALGDWCRDSKSLSKVSFFGRRRYFHGAFWFGSRDVILSVCELLARRTRLDYVRGVVAPWHDESHLNWYAAAHPESVNTMWVGSSYWARNPTLNKKKSLVESLDKKLTKDELRGRKG